MTLKSTARLAYAIDPLSMIFSERIYLIWVEILHPHIPTLEAMRQAIAEATDEEKKFIVRRAKIVTEFAQEAAKMAAG